MKKNFFRSLSMLAAIVFGTSVIMTSCASEDLLVAPAVVDTEIVTEDLKVKARRPVVEIGEEENAPAEVIEILKVDNNKWEAEMNDGNVIDLLHTGDVTAEEVSVIGVYEDKVNDNTIVVTIDFASKSSLNPSLTRSASYMKTIKTQTPPPVVDEPTIVRVYHVADTTMNCTLHEGESKQVTVNMNHKLTKVTEWSNGQNDSTLVWDKSFQVARAFLSANGGRIYSQTKAADLNFSSQVNWKKTKTSTDEAFTVTTNQGSVKFIAGYVCDAGYDQQWDGTSAVEAATVEVSYEDYSATYEFHFTEQFIGQKEESRNVPSEERGGHEYSYESTVVGSWGYSVNGVSLGVHPVEIEVFHF